MSSNQPGSKASGAADNAAAGGTRPMSAGEVAAAAAAAGSGSGKTGTGPGGLPPWERGGGAPGERPEAPGVESVGQTSALDRTPPAAADAKKAASPSAPPAGDPGKSSGRPRTMITGTAIPESLRDNPAPASAPAAASGAAATETLTKGAGSTVAPTAAGGPRRVGAGADRQSERTPTNGRAPLRASVQIRRIDPWATLKITAVVSVVGFFVWMVAVAVLYLIMDGMGVWGSLNDSLGSVTNTDSSGGSATVGAGTVFGIAALVGAVSAVLVTALAAIGSVIYNICADMVGGIEITLADRD